LVGEIETVSSDLNVKIAGYYSPELIEAFLNQIGLVGLRSGFLINEVSKIWLRIVVIL